MPQTDELEEIAKDPRYATVKDDFIRYTLLLKAAGDIRMKNQCLDDILCALEYKDPTALCGRI